MRTAPAAATLLFAATAACSSAPRAADHEALRPQPNAGMAERNDALAREAKDSTAPPVFLGDSITQGWKDGGSAAWNAYFKPFGALNLGVSGDRTENVLWRFRRGDYDALRPRLVVMMIGTNNTGHRMDAPEKIADGVGAILREIDARWHAPKILLLALFPRGAGAQDPMRKNNDTANGIIRGFADGKRVQWLDVGSRFTAPDGTLPKEIMPDQLHLTPKGYELWASAIIDAVRANM